MILAPEKKSEIKASRARINGLLGGRPKGALGSTMLTAMEARKWAINYVNERLTPLFEAMYKKALDGDVTAFKELLDRSWGKAVQAVEVSGKDGAPIVFMPLELIQKHALQIAESVSSLPEQRETVQAEIITPNDGSTKP